MAKSRMIPTQAETDLPTFTILSNGQEIGGEIGVESIMVSKSVNRIPTARLLLLDGSVPKEDFELSSGDLFVPGNEIEIKAGYHSNEDTIFKGIITKQSIQAKKGSPGRLIIEMKDEAVKMTIGRRNKYFEEQTDSDIIEGIIGDYGLQAEIEGTTVTHAEMVQHHASDWDFIVVRAEVNGKLVMVNDGKIMVKAPDLSSDPIVELAYGNNVYDFEAGMDARDQYNAVKSTSWDMANQEVVEEEGSDPGITEQGNFSATDLAGVTAPDELLLQHTGRVADEELRAWSDAQLMRSRLAKIQGKVKILGFSEIKPGDIINLAGFGDRFNGMAFVSSVSHRVTSDSVWFTEIEFGLDKDWFTSIYDDVIDKPAAGLLPAVQGLQIGIVTNIHEDPDGEDRIRVRLPIIDNENDGVWARMATTEAGDTRGFVFRPEIDDEVVVGFLNDDPRDPVILGSLFSSAKPPPFDPEEENNQKGITTRSGIRLLFDDDKVNVTIETPGGNKIVLDDDGGAINVEDSNGNKMKMTSDGITLESASDISIKATGDVSIEGVNINVKAQAQYKAEGSAGAEMSTSGQAVVKGSVVMIN
ncbi:MAG TPA: type VI secretion system tip protein VgrG [Bacteroidetes bacterium]|nr:type VI secretion system tip protein VgrG [Bacteroidota bacterium]